MQFADKDFDYYWEVIKIPVFLLIGWSVAAIIVGKLSYSMYLTIFGTWPSLVIKVAIMAFVGFKIVEDFNGEPRHSAWAGALTGAIVGFAGAILGILTIYFAPELIDKAIQQAIAQAGPGVSASLIRQMTNIMMYVSLVTGPLLGGLMGALIAWIGGFITKKQTPKV